MRFLEITMLAATSLPLSSYARLGGAPSTGASSANRGTGLQRGTQQHGVTIREYVLPQNVVFKVTWSRPIRPDMTALLGSYFPNFVNAGQSRAAGTGPLIDGNDDFRIESAGRFGRFSGMAWLPRLSPPACVLAICNSARVELRENTT